MRAKTSPATAAASSINNSRREKTSATLSPLVVQSLFPFFFPLFLHGICQLSFPSPPFDLSISYPITLSRSFLWLHRRLRAHARVQATSVARVIRATQTQPLCTRAALRVFSLFLSHSFKYNQPVRTPQRSRCSVRAKVGREKADARECVDPARPQRPTCVAHARERTEKKRVSPLFVNCARQARQKSKSLGRTRTTRRAIPTCCKCNATGDACDGLPRLLDYTAHALPIYYRTRIEIICIARTTNRREL